ncbi:hypothetical protein PO878_15840 [Iamia majanohamensis]|uniref:Hpr(Ser) kinase/phosphatase n=1 Tax=Iamia majanohamensis TaxID=467976 RepID=A0AAE9YBH9_9ACTN|nr:hypothetical protein [Iamia majanohamensis]WCO65972.1 hypothetical protein PO878_15840 [Iamia majanohamensis]
MAPSPALRAPVAYRMLWHRVEVTSEDPAVLDLVDRMSPAAEQDELAPEQLLGLDVVGEGSGFVVRSGPRRVGTAADARQAAELVVGWVHRTAFEEAAGRGWARLHGLVAERGGRRLVAVGPSGVGKTTLALALLAAGWEVQGDESFVTAAGRCLAVPRRFQVKPGTAAAVPEAAGWIARGDRLDHLPGIRITDPTVSGRPWRSTMGPIDHLVALVRTDGSSAVTPSSTPEALAALRSELFVTVDRPAALARALTDLVCAATLHRAEVGPDGRLAERLGTLVSG